MTLHLLWADPMRDEILADCLRTLLPGDALVFGGDAVRALAPALLPGAGLAAIDAGIGLHALASDCAELGIAIPPGVRAATPEDLLALVCAHPRSVSWF